MRIELRGVSKGRAERALPETSLTFETGRVTLAVAETEQRPTVLGLLASGRMRADTGEVLLDGRKDAAGIRRRVALVDALEVSEPAPAVTVASVVAEELMFAGASPNPFAARRWLDDLGLGELAGTPIGNIEPAARIRILLELAALRKGVEGIVLTSPDRHGGEPQNWWRVATEFAERGYAVLAIAGRASQSVLSVEIDASLPGDATGVVPAASEGEDETPPPTGETAPEQVSPDTGADAPTADDTVAANTDPAPGIGADAPDTEASAPTEDER